jgi:hypothetical protein
MAWEDRGRKVADYRTEIELGDGLPRDTMEDAQEATQWNSTGSISLEDLVRMRRPDYDDEAVQEELERIQAQKQRAIEEQRQRFGEQSPSGAARDSAVRGEASASSRNGRSQEEAPPDKASE